MSMKKAFDQTIRDLKREVNKKVLKVPSVEQKVLDATSNEPWGPHGSLLADVAQATRNYHEYQMIMAILWKRLNDTGKNWRHVYKALTVLEYLVAHGSERVIDEIKEHAYQISTLSDFQYIDSSGRDQGNNVRRKSQSLVVLVNDKERIQEVRQKAASNRDKFRSTSGGMYRPGSHSGSGGYGDDRYEGHDERNGYGREKEWGYRDDEKYGRYGDSYNREGDRYGRDSEEHYGRDRYGDDDSRGRAQSVDDYQYGSRSRSSDRDGDRAYDDDDRHSARGSNAKVEDHSDGRPIERKFSEQNLGAPPSYEEAVGVSGTPTYSDRDGEMPPTLALQSSSPPVTAAPQSSSPISNAAPQSSSPPNSINPSQTTAEYGAPSHPNMVTDGFDEFDPRGSVPAPARTSNTAELDLLGSLSDAFSPNPLAIMPAPSDSSDIQPDSGKTASNPSFTVASGSNGFNQSFEDPFGDSPFKAFPSDEAPTQYHNVSSPSSFQPVVNRSEHSLTVAPKGEVPNSEISGTLPGSTFNPATASDFQASSNLQYLPQEPQMMQDNDILAGILPPSGPFSSLVSHASGIPPATAPQTAFPPSVHTSAGIGFMTQAGPTAASFSQSPSQNMDVTSNQHNLLPYSAPSNAFNSNFAPQAPAGGSSHQNNDFMGGFLQQPGATIPTSLQLASSSSTSSLALVPHQPAEVKFEPKSAVWADTLSRGLVNLNISGPKANPLSDIGIDFQSLNRKEKRMEKPSATPTTSNVAMGKAMGSGSGMGRAGASRAPPNAMMGSGMGTGMGMGMGGGPGVGMGMGGYGSMNQQQMGMGIGVGQGMNMGMGQGVTMQPSNSIAPGSNMNNYNLMMGRGGYPQQPYGGAYR